MAKKIAEKDAEEDELIRQQSEISAHSRELKAGLAACIKDHTGQTRFMSQDVQAAYNEMKGVAAVGKAAATIAKRITESKEQRLVRNAVTGRAIEVVSNVLLEVNDPKEIDNKWTIDNF